MQVAIPEVTRSTPYEDLPQWVTVHEAAALLGVTTWCVYQGVHQGHIPHRRIGTKIIQIPKSYFHQDMATKQVTL